MKPTGREPSAASPRAPRGALLRGLLSSCAVVLAACGTDSAEQAPIFPRVGALTEGVVARVGSIEVRADTVARIAAARSIDAKAARDLAVRDALLASGAIARGLETTRPVQHGITAVLARELLSELWREAQAKGPATDAELKEVTERHWLDLDRPDAFSTVHAVVHVDKNDNAAKKKRAAELAEAILKATTPVREVARTTPIPVAIEPGKPPPEDLASVKFRALASAVPTGDLQVTVEALAPFAADGRVVAASGGAYDPAFARGAAALKERGDLSPPVLSDFGYHIILLLQRIPGHTVPVEERRKMVHEEVVTDRARAEQKKLIEQLRRNRVEVDRSADALLALVAVE